MGQRRLFRRLETGVPQLSAIIITKDEAANIGDCLDSLAFCDERIVVDAASSDGTMMIAKQKGARVATHSWKGFGPQKNYALSLAHGDWVLWDNRSVMHQANPDYDMRERRYLYRLMLKGEAPV